MDELLKYAYAGLLHDIGKFVQRTEAKSTLNSDEINCTPVHNLGYHTHLHSGYTSRFMNKYLLLNNDIAAAASEHHINDEETFHKAIREADRIASKIDRSDEEKDTEEVYKRNSFITSRLHSIMSDVNFGKELKDAQFTLSNIEELESPSKQDDPDKATAIQEYKDLYQDFIEEVTENDLLIGNPTPFKYQRMYALLYKYTTLIPASTYETNKPTVSLFDHLKLTSAIASCKYYSNKNMFYMLEFDVSGIQKFIYAITEGTETKKGIAKALRGRSILVSLITNAIAYSILKEFGLTQANIIFNTGGGGLLLLPYLDDTEERAKKVCTYIQEELYKQFYTDLTFVYALEEMNDEELESFKAEKELALKTKLETAKKQKYLNMIDDDFYFENYEDKKLCSMCGEHEVTENGRCAICNAIEGISDFYIRNDDFSIYYHLDGTKTEYDFGFVSFEFIPNDDDLRTRFTNKNEYFYIDAINHFDFGNIKLNANLVAKEDYKVKNFEAIAKSLPTDKYGYPKLAILKMDVDNLGAVFAFGLKEQSGEKQRALSKYLTLSRLMEYFFSVKLKDICYDLSEQLTGSYDNLFYINYAGGDDLVIIGPVYGIIQLANRIYTEFKDYVNNDNMTLSGGIHIQGPSKPIRFGIQESEEQLEMSKHYNNKEKNAITLLNTSISFTEFKGLLDKVTKYQGYIQSDKLSRTSFYTIMSNLPEVFGDKYYESIPIIEYSLLRQLGKDSPIRIELLNDITKANSEHELKYILLMMKLVILFTREA